MRVNGGHGKMQSEEQRSETVSCFLEVKDKARDYFYTFRAANFIAAKLHEEECAREAKGGRGGVPGSQAGTLSIRCLGGELRD